MSAPRGNGPIDTRRTARPRRATLSRSTERSRRVPRTSVHVLFVAKLRAFRESVTYFTRLLGLEFDTVASVAAALIVLTRGMVDIVIVDDALDVPTLLAAVQPQGAPHVMVIVITITMTAVERTWWERAGVFACIPKPFDLRMYRLVLERAVAAVRARPT